MHVLDGTGVPSMQARRDFFDPERSQLIAPRCTRPAVLLRSGQAVTTISGRARVFGDAPVWQKDHVSFPARARAATILFQQKRQRPNCRWRSRLGAEQALGSELAVPAERAARTRRTVPDGCADSVVRFGLQLRTGRRDTSGRCGRCRCRRSGCRVGPPPRVGSRVRRAGTGRHTAASCRSRPSGPRRR
jgi:hypothetical protein